MTNLSSNGMPNAILLLNLTRKGQLLLLTPDSTRFMFIFSKVAVHKSSENFILGFFNLKLNKQANLL